MLEFRLTDCSVVEEGENLVLPDGAANAATELLKMVVVPYIRISFAVVRLIGIQVGLWVLKNKLP